MIKYRNINKLIHQVNTSVFTNFSAAHMHEVNDNIINTNYRHDNDNNNNM